MLTKYSLESLRTPLLFYIWSMDINKPPLYKVTHEEVWSWVLPWEMV